MVRSTIAGSRSNGGYAKSFQSSRGPQQGEYCGADGDKPEICTILVERRQMP